MYVHAAAGEIGERFGHEGGAQPVFASDPFHNSPQQQPVVTGCHRILLVVGIDLPLPRRELAVNRSQRNPLYFAGLVYVVEKGIAVKKVVWHAVLNSRLPQARTGNPAQQRAWSGFVTRFQQIEFQFRRHCWRQAVTGVAVEDRQQWAARIQPFHLTLTP